MKPRAITGIGVVSSFGAGVDALRAGLQSTTAIAPASAISSFDATAYPAAAEAVVEVPDFDPTKHLGDKGLRTLDRLTKLLVVAARLSLHDAGLKRDNQWAALGPSSVGVCCSNAYGSLEAIHELDRVMVLEDARYINPSKFPNTVSNSAAGYVSIWEELRALNVSVSDGNCGALDAVACADLLLETGRADAILTGGGEAMSEALYLAFDKLHALGALPGALARRGATRLGEGAAFLVLEPTDRAEARGIKTLATICGYGTAFCAPHEDVPLVFASRPAMRRAIEEALEDAQIDATAVDLVVSGLSGIESFDTEELGAINAVFGEDTAIAAPKAFFGEALGAGGALAMAAATAWLDGASPVSALVRGAVAEVRTVLLTSIGYHGNASALVMRRA